MRFLLIVLFSFSTLSFASPEVTQEMIRIKSSSWTSQILINRIDKLAKNVVNSNSSKEVKCTNAYKLQESINSLQWGLSLAADVSKNQEEKQALSEFRNYVIQNLEFVLDKNLGYEDSSNEHSHLTLATLCKSTDFVSSFIDDEDKIIEISQRANQIIKNIEPLK